MQKNILRFFSLSLALFVSLAVFAGIRSQAEAQREAISFLTSGMSGRKSAPSTQSVTLGYTVQKINSSDAAAYLFQIGEDNGFVLVSADDNTTTILGYADDGRFDATNIPENMQVWLQHYAEEISWASEHGGSMRSARKSEASPISPLLGDIVWNQDKPFWNQCPKDSDGKRSYTGCVATAAAQIMCYWKYPETGQGSHSYVWTKSNGTKKTLSADFGSTTYDWDNMLPDYNDQYTTDQADAVATLMYHLGVATDMEYSSNGSGTQTEKVALALYTYFGYDKSMYAVRPDYVGFEVFESKMLEELQAGRPVLMSGRTEYDEGHAFVCDGYDGQFFHINWGWGGYENAYFALSALDPDEQGLGGAASGAGYHIGILGIMGITPDQGGELAHASLGTLGIELQAANQIRTSDTFIVTLNEINNSGIADYEGGAVGLAILNENNDFIDWFDAFMIGGLPVGYFFPGEIDFTGKLSAVVADGEYKIVPIYTDAEVENFWPMDVSVHSPQYISFTKTGNIIIFDESENPNPDYSVTDLIAYSSGTSIYFSFESNAPKFHVRIYNDTEECASGIIDFKNVEVSDVPDGEWTVWVRPCDEAEQNYLADAVSTTVTVGGSDEEYYITNLTATASGHTIQFSFEGNAPYYHAKIYNSQSVLADAYIDFSDAELSDVPAGEWTVWVCAADANKNDVGEPQSVTVVVEDIDYNVYNLEAYSEGSSVYFTFESNAPKFHVKVYNDTEVVSAGVIDFKDVVVNNVPDGEWTVWVRPCDEAEEYYIADAVSTTVTVAQDTYVLTYIVDGEVYKSVTYAVGAAITPEAEPTKEGYTFSGWSEIPEIMPAHDVEVTGSFTINKYTVKFVNEDGTVLQSDEVEYGATPVYVGTTPTKAATAEFSYTFTGWTPEIVAVTGDATYTATYTSSVNKYTIKFVNEDGTILQSDEVEYGATPVYVGATPTKAATAEFSYNFAGWTPEIVAVTADATYTATYTSTPNSYKLTYKVDGDVYKEYTLSYGDAITPEAEPTKEGYTFSGWSEIPATMPAYDVEVNGSFAVNYYKVSYFVGDELIHEDEVAFGQTFELWIYEPEDDDLTFNGWIGDIYDTMPAHDISYVADITTGIAYIINNPESVLGIYTLDGKQVEKAELMHHGVYVVRMKNGTITKVQVK